MSKSMITFEHRGDLRKTTLFLKRNQKLPLESLDKFGEEGVQALSEATPVDSGLTASSWSYRIRRNETLNTITIEWLNSNFHNGVPIAIILQYGHATRNGGYVEGRDYINPAIQPIFDRIVEDAWKEVTRG